MKSSQSSQLMALAKRQGGLLTREQVLALRLSNSQWRTLAKNPFWEKAGRGVLRIAGQIRTWEQRVWAACLETGGHASHKTAAWLWRLDGLGTSPPRELDVIVRYENLRKSKGAKVHRSRTLTDAHLAKPQGIPRTTLLRTLIDLAEVLTEEDYEDAYDSAVRKDMELPGELKQMLARFPGYGHKGIATLKSLLDEGLRAVDSALEVKVRRLIRKSKLPAPVEGHQVFDGNIIIGKLDFAWPDNKPRVAVMAQGAKYHQKTKRWNTDNDQSGDLSSMGWRVLPCSMRHVNDPYAREKFVLRLKRSLAGFESAAEFED
jgi:hypothetical protein